MTHINYKKEQDKIKKRVLMNWTFSWEDEAIYLIAMSQLRNKKINPQRRSEVSITV